MGRGLSGVVVGVGWNARREEKWLRCLVIMSAGLDYLIDLIQSDKDW